MTGSHHQRSEAGQAIKPIGRYPTQIVEEPSKLVPKSEIKVSFSRGVSVFGMIADDDKALFDRRPRAPAISSTPRRIHRDVGPPVPVPPASP